MAIRRRLLLFPLAVAATLVAGPSARADAIDGTWCSADGRFLEIRGPAIVTPGGTAITGDYRRHFFSYVVPSAEPNAGGTVSMTQLNENTIRVSPPGAEGATEIWQRCAGPVS